jgi:hypothetical protein
MSVLFAASKGLEERVLQCGSVEVAALFLLEALMNFQPMLEEALESFLNKVEFYCMIWLNSHFSRQFEFKNENPDSGELLKQLNNFKHLIGVEMFSFLPFQFNPTVNGGLKELSSMDFSEFKRLVDVDFSGFDEMQKPGLEKMAFSTVVNRFFIKDFKQDFIVSNSKTKDFIFFVREGDWVLVKKVKADSPREDILFTLSGSMETLQAKTAQLSTGKWIEFQIELQRIEPKRAGFSNISKALNQLGKFEFSRFSEEPSTLKEYAFYYVLNKAGFPPFITREEVSMVYPQFKIVKPRGRISKK